jgi:antitoxin ParD1/3/4
MDKVEKLSVTVTAAMARDIPDKIELGNYASASEVIRAALRALGREEEEHAERMASIKARIRASVEDARPAVALDQAFERIRDRLVERSR